MNSTRTNLLMTTVIVLASYSCMVTSHSEVYDTILSNDLSQEELGKAKFLYGDMGGIYPHTLKTNAIVYKIAVLALLAVDSAQTTQSLFKKYGFQFPKRVWNWKTSPPLSADKPTGLIFGKLSGRHPLNGKFVIETADFGCGTCHGGPLYDKNGLPSDAFVPGMPNTSINLQAYGNDLFEGYQIIIQWNEKKSLRRRYVNCTHVFRKTN